MRDEHVMVRLNAVEVWTSGPSPLSESLGARKITYFHRIV